MKSRVLELANIPTMEPERFQILIEALEREQARDAADAFHAAFLKMAPYLPEIAKNGEIVYRTGEQGSYAKHEDIQDAVKQILNDHGFYQTFSTEYPTPNTVRVVGFLTHRKGHATSSAFESSPDSSGQKTGAQGRGSIMAYGRRYTTVDLLNLTTRGEDKDGAEHEPEPERGPEPDGYGEWLIGCVEAASHRGVAALADCWGAASPEYRWYITLKEWDYLKALAERTDVADAPL